MSKSAYHSLWYHIIWSTKFREPSIQDPYKGILKKEMKRICLDNDYQLHTASVLCDHIHLLIRLKPFQQISEVVKTIKGKTWKWGRDNLPEQIYLTWQNTILF